MTIEEFSRLATSLNSIAIAVAFVKSLFDYGTDRMDDVWEIVLVVAISLFAIQGFVIVMWFLLIWINH